jgi:DNA repair exonuclease SbcCD nuclease subunit
MKPYGIISDTHNHAWSAFATVNANGVNSRLQTILDETERCAQEVRAAGGKTIYHTGDLFHVRGSIAPSVLNPTKDLYKKLIMDGFEIVLLPGNHDLESKESTRLGSAVTSLEDIGCRVIHTAMQGLRDAGDRVIMIPWIQDIAQLKREIETARDSESKPGDVDLMIHAPIDGVIPGLPDHGLDAAWLGSIGFKRVFSGHYHHHKDFGNGVYSVGALSHHSWSDVNSKAGFLVVTDSNVRWFKSHAPAFVEIDASTDPADIPLIVDGNYARAKISSSNQKDVEDLRAYLTDCGAAGVTILHHKTAAATPRAGTALVKSGETLEASVGSYIKAQAMRRPEDLATLCQDILSEAQAVTV